MEKQENKMHITFEPNIGEPLGSRLVLRVGGALIRSYQMSADDHYRDLFAVRYFLGRRTLSSIMFGDEPVGAIDFLNDSDFVVLTPYERPDIKKSSGKFHLSEGLNHIDDVLNELSAVISTDRALLERQVVDDIEAGVYEGCVMNQH